MNKELIKKYKQEFEYWMTGGELLFKPEDKQTWFDTLRSEIDWSVKGTYVINDTYVQLRIALAEGKTIQVYKCIEQNISNPSLDIYGWKDFKPHSPFSYNVENYRIKPKFKVGDWVRCYDLGKELIVQITGEYYPKDDAYLCSNGPRNTKFLEHWQPKLGEWCIMYDTDENPNASSVTLQKWDGKNKWKPIPFIGQLPPYIKASNGS